MRDGVVKSKANRVENSPDLNDLFVNLVSFVFVVAASNKTVDHRCQKRSKLITEFWSSVDNKR